MSTELGKISLLLSKVGNSFESVLDPEKVPSDTSSVKKGQFDAAGFQVEFICQHASNPKPPPPWVDFINEKLDVNDEIAFRVRSERLSGLLLIRYDDRIFAATFGVSSLSWLHKHKFEPDFGIKVAMNLCGNTELRQARTSTHSHTTHHIDRQLSKPSEAFDFGLNETELLRYISAHLEHNKNITLQGKDSLTLKTIRDEKVDWEQFIDYLDKFYKAYDSDKYKKLFPNYPNFTDVPEEKVAELNSLLDRAITSKDFSNIHLAIPEFIADDEFGFSYSNNAKRENTIVSHIEIDDLYEYKVIDEQEVDVVNQLKKKWIFAYSHDTDEVLSYKKWNVFSCLVAEVMIDNNCYILTSGKWQKIDETFYNYVTDYVRCSIEERKPSPECCNIDIFCPKQNKNREAVFNSKYCDDNSCAILFDQAKLKIGGSNSDKEFCDILELVEDGRANIVHVKRFGGSVRLTIYLHKLNSIVNSFCKMRYFYQIYGNI